MKKVSSTVFWQTTFALTFIVNLAILIWSIARWVELKVVMWRSVWMLPLALYVGALTGCAFLFIWIRKGKVQPLLQALELESLIGITWRIGGMAVFAGILLLIPTLKFTFHIGEVVKKSTQDPTLAMIVFYWLVWWLVLLAAGALKVAFKSSWQGGFAAALVLMGLVYEIFMRFQAVNTYPFSLGWSEASRFYYASLYFAQSIYDLQTPLSTLHPSRYLLQSLPFLFPGLGLTASRLWQVLLWVGLTGASSTALAWRAFPPLRFGKWSGLRLLYAGWIFLFLLRVGVYYHLEVMVLVPLVFVSARHPWRSLVAVIFASAWAGISRVNWFPMPAMLATALYLLEEPIDTSKDIRHYLAQPFTWIVAGMVSALAAQSLYIPLSGNAGNATAFVSSFFSQLLWYRLWPNDSFALGVVPAIVIVCSPLLATLLTAGGWANKPESSRPAIHPVRWLGLWSMLIILFAGGLVVSVKIGGGGDLHNMDAFAVLLVLTAMFFVSGQTRSEDGQKVWEPLTWPVAAIALLIPLFFLIPLLSPLPKFNQNGNLQAFRQLKELAENAGKNGPVLFINERHLLTFHEINLPLVPEYEAVSLMESAMSNNQTILQQFYGDLENHRFAAIVTGKQNVGIKEEGAFTEENNAWNSRVSPYILCYYEPVLFTSGSETRTYLEADESRIEFYVPRSAAGVCP